MTTKSDFTEEEWARVRRAPFVAGLAISMADPGGPIELAKESMGTVKSATNPPSREQLIAEIALDIQSMTQQRQNPLSGFKPQAPQQILDEVRAATDLVSAKATAEEAAAYKHWLLTSAQGAADAAKDGGFMGFGATQVSEGEQKMLDQLRTTIGALLPAQLRASVIARARRAEEERGDMLFVPERQRSRRIEKRAMRQQLPKRAS